MRPRGSRAYSPGGCATHPIRGTDGERSEIVLYHNFDSGLGREQRTRMRRELERRRLSAARPIEGGTPEGAFSRKSPAARGAVAVPTVPG